MRLLTYKSPFGPGVIVMSGTRVKYHLWGGKQADLSAAVGRLAPAARPAKMPSDLSKALNDYWLGAPVDLSKWQPSLAGVSEFSAQVYEATRGLRWGQTASYSQVAAAIGKRGAARAVGGALAKNPVPLFVPCHRVVSSEGEGGWSGPPGLKTKLLGLEGAVKNEIHS